jgi:hypothetical protein
MATKQCKKIERLSSKSTEREKAEIEQLINVIKKRIEQKNGAKKAALIIEELIKKIEK